MTAQTATESKAVLRLDGVTKAYGTNLILDHISFDVHEHEVVALLGPSGSGKSTLMKCVNLLERVPFVHALAWFSNSSTCSHT